MMIENLKTSLVGPSDKGYRCNCLWSYRVSRIPFMAIATLVLLFGAWVLIDGHISHSRRD